MIDFLVARYGEFVLLKPRVQPGTRCFCGWRRPLVLVGGGIAGVRVDAPAAQNAAGRSRSIAEEERRLDDCSHRRTSDGSASNITEV